MALSDLTLAGSGDSSLPAAPQTSPTQAPSASIVPSAPSNPYTQQAQAAYADMNAAQQAAAQPQPTYTAPTLSGAPSFFGRLLQGALNGLAGGLAQGQTNVAGAGTPGFTPVGGGISYAEKLQQQQDQKQAEADKAKQANAQQDFENQQKMFQQKQLQTLQQVQAAKNKMAVLDHLQALDHADQDARDKQQASMDAQLKEAQDAGAQVTDLKVQPGQNPKDVMASFIQANPGWMANPNHNATVSYDGEGNVTAIHAYVDDANRRVPVSLVNQRLKAIPGSTLQMDEGDDAEHPTTMTVHDMHNVMAQEHTTSAQRLYDAKKERDKADAAAALEAQKEAAARQLEGIRQSGENSRAAAKNNPISAVDGSPLANSTPDENGVRTDFLNSLPSTVQGTVRAIGEGRMAPPNPRTKEGKALSDQVTSAYPNYDASKFHAYQAAKTKATSGDLGKAITAGNTAITHVAEMVDNADALSVLPGAGYAARKGVFGAQAQQQAQNFETAQNAAAEEVNKAIKGGVLGVEEGKRALSDIHSWTPGEAKSKGVSLLHLLKDRLDAQQDTLNQASVTGVAPFKVMNDKAQSTFNRLTAAQSTPSTRPAGATHTAKGSDGKMHYTNAQGQDLGVAQ